VGGGGGVNWEKPLKQSQKETSAPFSDDGEQYGFGRKDVRPLKHLRASEKNWSKSSNRLEVFGKKTPNWGLWGGRLRGEAD